MDLIVPKVYPFPRGANDITFSRDESNSCPFCHADGWGKKIDTILLVATAASKECAKVDLIHVSRHIALPTSRQEVVQIYQ
jgi:hypothetical protein